MQEIYKNMLPTLVKIVVEFMFNEFYWILYKIL